MSYKKRSEWKDDFVDTGKTLTEDDLLEENLKKGKQEKEEKQEKPEKVTIQVVEKPDKSQEYLEMAQRIQAEFDNYRRRNLDIAKNSRQDGIAFAVTELLPILDTINSAKRQIKDETFAKAIDAIYKQTLDCFAKIGVTKIEAVGKPFDPNYHNAIMAEEVKGTKPDMVLDEFQEGFMMNGKIIRHSVVKVSK